MTRGKGKKERWRRNGEDRHNPRWPSLTTMAIEFQGKEEKDLDGDELGGSGIGKKS
ncbi:unnamed protein product [Linum tenue]|uniref:Uncharacterized protein n=2 Tax=Linum tenue TaxID=586396 RepID=A0AAV0R5J3_9ROSI|nr:unnamed protein product [Linum tenue]